MSINDFFKGLNSNVKLYAGDVSLFAVALDPAVTTKILYEDLTKIFSGCNNGKERLIQIT